MMESVSGGENGQILADESGLEDEERAEVLGKLVLKLAQEWFLLNLVFLLLNQAFFLPN